MKLSFFSLLKDAGLFLAYIALSSYGLYKIKVAELIVSVSFAVGFTSYALGFLMWFYILRLYPLSLAFPIAAGGLIIATNLVGAIWLKEPYTALNIAGIVLIIVGMTMVYLRAC